MGTDEEEEFTFYWNNRGYGASLQSSLDLECERYVPTSSLLVETGYFTKKRSETFLYPYFFNAVFPNKEAKNAFIRHEVNAAKSASKENNIGPNIRKMRDAIHQAIPDFNAFIAAADAAIIKLPHYAVDEKDYKLNLYHLLHECNVNVYPWTTYKKRSAG